MAFESVTARSLNKEDPAISTNSVGPAVRQGVPSERGRHDLSASARFPPLTLRSLFQRQRRAAARAAWLSLKGTNPEVGALTRLASQWPRSTRKAARRLPGAEARLAGSGPGIVNEATAEAGRKGGAPRVLEHTRNLGMGHFGTVPFGT